MGSRAKLQQREKEETILLSLSTELAAVSSRSDLLSVLAHQLKELFPITDFAITLIDEGSITDSVFNRILHAERPIVLRLDELAEEAGAPDYIRFWQNKGIERVLGVPLRTGDGNFGCLIFHLAPSYHYTGDDLLKGVIAQISVAVSRIKAGEELTKREEEKTILLSFSNEIADIKNRAELFEVVVAKIKKIFGIERFLIARINEDRTTFSAFASDPAGSAADQLDYASIVATDYHLDDGVFGRAVHTDEPVLFDVDALSREPDAPLYVGFWKRLGLQYVLIVTLRVGGETIGFAVLNFNTRERIVTKSALLKGICAQLAVKVSQILAYEEIEHRDKEKSILLSFNNEIAAIRTRQDFLDVVIAKLKRTFAIERFGIAKINEDRETVSRFILDPAVTAPLLPDYAKIVSANYPIRDPVFAKAMASDSPVLFDINRLAGESGAPAYIAYWKSEGLRFAATMALRVAGNAIGFAIMRFDNMDKLAAQSVLMQGICAQLAVKMSQILAYEEIEKREREKSMLLAFSNAIAAERDKNALAKALKQQLKALFHIEDYVIHALSDDKKYHTPILFDPDADFASHPDFMKLVNHWTAINDGVFNVALASPDPVTINLERVYTDNPPVYADAAKAINLKKLTAVALRLGQETIGVLNFKQDDRNEFVIQDRLFKSICSQIAISFANIIANEKVNQQLSEIKKYKEQLEEEKIYLKEEIETSINYTEIVGESLELKKVFRMIAQVAYTDSTVLLLGETGTGKELVARAIHNSSPRKSKLMIKVNCAAIPATLIESELFGHERGSFTGAVERRIGKFELANNGTLFLDEVGEMTLDVQVKLLRALQEKEIERVGGKTVIRTNVRIIAATNRDLDKLMAEGRFRGDLYYRLNIFPITIPPLRSREDDIPKLALYFIDRYSKKSGKKIKSLSNKVLQELMQYDWPGNIRELEHLIERSVLLATGDSINEIHLPQQKRIERSGPDQDDVVIKTIQENEKEHILKVLKYVKGRIGGKGGAAELLGLPPSTLNSRIKKLGIRREHMG